MTDAPYEMSWAELRTLDPLSESNQDRVWEWVVQHRGEQPYNDIRERVAKSSAMAVMVEAVESADGDFEMLVAWCLAMRAQRMLAEMN